MRPEVSAWLRGWQRVIAAAAAAALLGLLLPTLAVGAEATPPEDEATASWVPIADLLRDSDGDTIPDAVGRVVRVRGVVTIASRVLSNRNFYAMLQDASGGVAVFSPQPLEQVVEDGDQVEVRGRVGQFRGAVQLQNIELKIVGREALPAALPIAAEQADGWRYMGRRVRVEGIAGPLVVEGFARLRLNGDDGSTLALFIPVGAAREFDWSRYPQGSRLAVTGVVSIYKHTWPYDGGFQLYVARPADIEVLAPPLPRWQRWAYLAALPAALLVVLALAVFVLLQRRQRSRQRELAVLSALSAGLENRELDSAQLARRACDLLVAFQIVEAAAVCALDGQGRPRLLAVSAHGPRAQAALAQRAEATDPDDAPASGAEGSEEAVDLQAWLRARMRRSGHALIAVQALSTVAGREGLLAALGPQPRRLGALAQRTLLSAAKLLALALDNRRLLEEAQREQQALHQLAVTDALTGLYNRRFLDDYLRVQVPVAQRRGGGLAFLAIDIDHFKRINDQHGHPLGDAVLQRVAAALRSAARSSDLLVRMGGEEFLVVIAEHEAERAMAFAERLRAVVEAAPMDDLPNAAALRVTVSVGVALFGPHGNHAEALLQASDQALYAAKRGGRNRVERAPD